MPVGNWRSKFPLPKRPAGRWRKASLHLGISSPQPRSPSRPDSEFHHWSNSWNSDAIREFPVRIQSYRQLWKLPHHKLLHTYQPTAIHPDLQSTMSLRRTGTQWRCFVLCKRWQAALHLVASDWAAPQSHAIEQRVAKRNDQCDRQLHCFSECDR